MKTARSRRFFTLALAFVFLAAAAGFDAAALRAQSGRTQPSKQTTGQKKNKRPDEQKTAGEGQEPLPPDLVKQKPQDDEVLKVTANLVNVDAVVYHKKTKQLVGNLTKAN